MSTAGSELVDEFTDLLQQNYRDELAEFVQNRSPEHRSVVVEFSDVHEWSPALADDLVESPKQIRPKADEALHEALKSLPVADQPDKYGPVHVRFAGLSEAERRGTGDCRSRHIGRYMEIEGQVSKVSQITPTVDTAAFECQRCGTITPVPQADGGLQEPHECQGCERQGPFVLEPDESEWKDTQLVRIQQPPEETLGGRGATLDVLLDDDAVVPLNEGVLKPGNRVTVSGRYTIRREKDGPTQYLDGDVIQPEETDYEEIEISQTDRERIEAIAAGEEGDPYELVQRSIAPDHHGDAHIKLALALQMFRGVRAQRPDGSWTRGDSHLLLLGDPGTGKSSLLRRVADIAPRSAYASGKGASAAGMTAAAVPSDFGDEKWDVEAGVLVLSTGGIACVDEIDKVQEDAVSSMHDALEAPQVVEVDKADIHATLPAQTSLLAAGNPKHGRFDDYNAIYEQIDIAPPLLSRFDLMFMLKDQPDEERDRDLADAMIGGRTAAIQYDHHNAAASETDMTPPLTAEFLRKYVAYARQQYHPYIDDAAVRNRLVSLFIELRSAGYDQDNPIPVTPRKLEAMQRLVEASARIRCSPVVEAEDVDRVANLIIRSMNELGVNEEGQFDADVVETGTSKSQRQLIQALRDVVREIDGKSDDAAPIQDVTERLVSEGYENDRVEHAIVKLKSRGELYEPSDDQLRVSD